MFGEFSFLDMEARSSSAVAPATTRTFIIDRDDLQRLFAKKPAAALDIMAILGQRIYKTDNLLRMRVARNANEVVDQTLTFGQRLADEVARFGGSCNLIIVFGTVMVCWLIVNTWMLHHQFE